ncbi:MAG TPA: cupredoxin domain-containing protein [Candidatus Polarisedimenticolia bacterium]|nr:cupredoxin domain-containing protein [Candidatus Polarisedimenticolia bacterium]
MQQIFDQLLKTLEAFVIPDWGALIAIIPLGLAGLTALWLLFMVYRFATLGPSRRGKRRIAPLPPPGVHMPGGSYAPIFGALGSGLLFGGLVFGGPLLAAGLVVLVFGLLYWGREALAEYDRLHPRTLVPALASSGPPPGVHIPAPSFRPFLGALATTALFAGLVAMGEKQPDWDVRPPLIVIVSILILAWALLGWLRDARHEYVEAVSADRTGHLRPLDAPGWPKKTLIAWVVLLVVAGAYQFGVVPPRPKAPAGAPGASAEPTLPPGTYEVKAQTIAFDKKDLSTAADAPFAIHFINADPAGVPHDIDIRDKPGGTILENQETIDGGTDTTYQYTALKAGTYTFECSIHSNMVGTLTVH